MIKIGLLGGSFNPIHLGHLVLAQEAWVRLGLERVLFVPNRTPPHKPKGDLAPPEHRLRMAELAVEGAEGFEASDIELRRDGPSYSIQTVRELRERSGGTWDIHFLVGSDSLPELPTWYRIGQLAELCKFAVFHRPGAPLDDLAALRGTLSPAQIQAIAGRRFQMPLIGISSTDIRRRVRQGRPIRYLVPEAVRRYILDHELYRP
ncbi:MAG: nicotinate-nucleotide adenylyltransferase [Candidatus Brocadiia bacterium]